MRINQIIIHNFRSIIDVTIEAHDYLMLVGANNSGKSNVINALRAFYDDLTWSNNDFPKRGAADDESWIKITFALTDEEWSVLAPNYKGKQNNNTLIVKRYFKGAKVKPKQSNIYAIVDGDEGDELFYGAKNVSTAKVGNIVYIPALTTPNEQMKTSGPSPFRNMLNFMLKKIVQKSEAYAHIEAAFKELNDEANKENGFLSEIATPINKALSEWDIKLDMSVNPVSTDDISKGLIKPSFVDKMLGEDGFELDRYGHGFQRSVIYELIKLSPTFKDEKDNAKKEFNPDFDLILFEEPEAFLHPAQQEIMALNLRMLGNTDNQQVFITTHSPIFVGKNSGQIPQIVRLMKVDGVSKFFQLKQSDLNDLFSSNRDFLKVLKDYIDNSSDSKKQKEVAQHFVDSAPQEEISLQHEKFRYQLWLDSDKASMFFADKVLLVEGATEKALFNYLLSDQWHDLSQQRIFVVDALGKYNFHRFMSLFKSFGIPHGIMFDDDKSEKHHAAINQLILNKKNSFTLADPVLFQDCLETSLGLPKPGRGDQKPLDILRAISEDIISEEHIDCLRKQFCSALDISDD
ncbi:MAG: AAA family ATPase [Candidatus Cloacimonadaceae bacterium]|nr:AAA family ATPase [Candidatus Cloacimonadaceae bacterium]